MNDQPDDQRKSTDSTPAPFEAERTKARKVVQGFTQALIQWMPLGGSGSIFVSFLRQSEWLQALLMFPVIAVTVVWAAYSEAVLTRLREISQERGRKDVDSFVGWLEAINESIRWQLAGTEDKYLRCQGSACRDYETEGFNQPFGIFMPLLGEVFVPLELSDAFIKNEEGEALPGLPGYRNNQLLEQELSIPNPANIKSIWYFLSQAQKVSAFRNLAILAWGGYGKTTLLRHITYCYTSKQYRRYQAPFLIPVLLYLRKCQDLILSDNPPDLPTLIEQHHLKNLPKGKELKLPPAWAFNQLSKGKMLVMFDGFDEVREGHRGRVSQWIGEQMSEYSDSIYIVTSRPKAFNNDYQARRKLTTIYVKNFNAEQRETFVQKWYLAQERYRRGGRNTSEVTYAAEKKTANLLEQLAQRSELADLAKNPLLLNIIVNLHQFHRGNPLPKRRTELYQNICKLQLKDRPEDRGIRMLLPLKDTQGILQRVALNMVKDLQKAQISKQKLIELVDQHLRTRTDEIEEPVDSNDFVKQIEQVSELIVKRDYDYEFAHLSFQNYLAAVEIQKRNQLDLLLRNWQEEWWRETILLYAALVRNPSNLIRALCDIGTESAVALAYDCLKESPRKVSPELEEELKNLRYQKLQKYLQNGQWKEADEETYRLMTSAVGKEEGQWLDSEDLKNFPCEELRTINQLWLSNSDQKFGFSVHLEILKEIYESQWGRRREYNYNEQVLVFERFGDRVGWRKEENWMWSYSDLFDMTYENAKRGHLPTPPNYKACAEAKHLSEKNKREHLMTTTQQWSSYSSLARRLVTCKI